MSEQAMDVEINEMMVATPKKRGRPKKANGTVPVVENPSGIRPVEFKVLVRPIKVEEKTAGGILIPAMAQDREQAAAVEGEIVAVSPFAFGYEIWKNEADKPKPGDRVYFAKFAGMTAKGRDGVEYRLMNDKDVCAVIAA